MHLLLLRSRSIIKYRLYEIVKLMKIEACLFSTLLLF